MSKNTLKSIGAVLAGLIAGVVLSLGTDFVLETLGIFPAPSEGFFITWMVVLAIVYRSVYSAVGGYVTATLAPSRPMLHALILGIIALAANLIGLIATWGKELGPAYYPILLTVLALPSVLLGGRLKGLSSRSI